MKFKFIYIILIFFTSTLPVFSGGFDNDPGPEEMMIIEDEVIKNQEIVTEQVAAVEFMIQSVALEGNVSTDIASTLEACTTSKTVVMWSEGCVKWTEGYALWSGVGW